MAFEVSIWPQPPACPWGGGQRAVLPSPCKEAAADLPLSNWSESACFQAVGKSSWGPCSRGPLLVPSPWCPSCAVSLCTVGSSLRTGWAWATTSPQCLHSWYTVEGGWNSVSSIRLSLTVPGGPCLDDRRGRPQEGRPPVSDRPGRHLSSAPVCGQTRRGGARLWPHPRPLAHGCWPPRLCRGFCGGSSWSMNSQARKTCSRQVPCRVCAGPGQMPPVHPDWRLGASSGPWGSGPAWLVRRQGPPGCVCAKSGYELGI